MALVLIRYSINGQHGSGRIINTKNVETFMKLENRNSLKFRVYLMNGENYDFNQLYYEGNFAYVYDMYQLYSLLTKLDSGVIQDGSA